MIKRSNAQPSNDSEALRIALEATKTSSILVENFFRQVPKRWMAEIVCQTGRFH